MVIHPYFTSDPETDPSENTRDVIVLFLGYQTIFYNSNTYNPSINTPCNTDIMKSLKGHIGDNINGEKLEILKSRWTTDDWFSHTFDETLRDKGFLGFSFHGKLILDVTIISEAKQIFDTHSELVNYLRLRLFHTDSGNRSDMWIMKYNPHDKSLVNFEMPNEISNLARLLHSLGPCYFIVAWTVTNPEELESDILKHISSPSIIPLYEYRAELIASSIQEFYAGNFSASLTLIGSAMCEMFAKNRSSQHDHLGKILFFNKIK